MQFRFNSFATRLSVHTMIFTILIFTVVMVVFYTRSRDIIIQNTMKHTHGLLADMATQIDDKLNLAEVAVLNSEWIIKENIDNPDSLYKIVTSIVHDNELIIGSSIAFEPNYYPEKGKYFLIYAYEQNNKIIHKRLGSDTYDYFSMDWYQIPTRLKKSYWSEPYYDKNGGDIMMSTFSYPIINSKGKVIAMLTADISLEQISSIVKKLEIYGTNSSFLLSRNGYYVTNAKDDGSNNETIFSSAAQLGNKQLELLGRDMIDGKTGLMELEYDGEPWYAFYTSIPDIGWSLCKRCPSNLILEDLQTTSRNTIIIFIIGIILIYISTSKVIKNLTKPLEEFSTSANEIAKGKFNVPLPQITTNDEMQSLRDSFSVMQTSLADYIEELKISTINKERIESELHIAREIQMGMLPKIFPPFPERTDINLHAVLQPAKEVGGDLYDFFIHQNDLYFTVGDVSGKGVPASLVMAIASSIFRSVARTLQNPADIMNAINTVVCERNTSNMFVTLLVGILDLKTGVIRLCNAGHNPLIYINAENKAAFIKIEQNLPVGVIDDFVYKEDALVIEPTSRIILYTDGVTEAENEKMELYSDAQLLKTVQDICDLNATTIIGKLLQSISEHVKDTPPSDDLTILEIQYKPNDIRPMERELIIENDIKSIEKIEAFVEELGEALHLPDTTIATINLAIEEAVANIIMYAYPPPEKNLIKLFAKYEEKELTFVLTDSGLPFDPTGVGIPDLEAKVEDRPIGGLGILLIRNIMNTVIYQRIEGENQLTLTKIIE